jgi:hypothetical protein
MGKIVQTKSGIFTIRPYAPGDGKGVFQLWNKAFGKEMPADVWQWKYVDNPFGHRIMLCFSEDHVPVAMYSGIPYSSRFNRQKASFIHPMDNMSHPEYRGVLSGRKGLFSQTAEYFFDLYGGPQDSIFMYGFPGERHYRLGQILLKYGKLPEGAAYFRALPGDLKKKFRAWTGKIDIVDAPGPIFDNLCRSLDRFFPFMADRGAKFIKWRFFDHPRRKYQVFVYKSFLNRVRGYAVFSVESQAASMVDFLFPPENRVITDFFSRISQEICGQNIKFVQTWIPGSHFMVGHLLKAGFRSFKEPLGIVPVGRSFYDGLSFEYAASNIYYTMADGDLF